jgi:hypothetical protein
LPLSGAYLLSHWDQIVNLEDHPHALSGETDLTEIDEQRLDNFFIPHIADGASTNIDPSRGVALVVFVSELCD